jgi:hypothetical protein
MVNGCLRTSGHCVMIMSELGACSEVEGTIVFISFSFLHSSIVGSPHMNVHEPSGGTNLTMMTLNVLLVSLDLVTTTSYDVAITIRQDRLSSFFMGIDGLKFDR